MVLGIFAQEKRTVGMDEIGGAAFVYKRHFDHLAAIRTDKAVFGSHPADSRATEISIPCMFLGEHGIYLSLIHI